MVQEVQTWVGITNETTLETIEAIGTSSFKIVEWRQTKGGHYVSECSWKWNVRWHWDSPAPKLWPVIQWSWSLDSTTGKAQFQASGKGIRVPVAWSYEISLSWGSATIANSTLIVKASGKELYKKTINGSGNTSATFQVDLWKFEIIEMWAQFEYTSSNVSADLTFTPQPKITIKQL